MVGGQIGDILKAARQEKGFSVREVSEEIHIMPRYIEALERDDYSIFPGETYITGFLTRYAEFLGLNPEQILQQYRGVKLEHSEAPLKELTEVTRPGLFSVINSGMLQKAALILAGILMIAGLIYGVMQSSVFKSSDVAGVTSCADRTGERIGATGSIDTVTMLDPDRAVLLDTESGDLKVCMKSIDRSRSDRPLVVMEFIYGGKSFDVTSGEGETVPLQTNIPTLGELKNPIVLTVREIGDVSIKLQIKNETAVTSTKPITVVLEIVQDSYLEWTADGKTQTAGYLTPGEKRTLEADSRLEVKMGNGGGVRIYREGMPPRLAGPPAKIVRLTLSKIPNPLDPTRYEIQEELTVAR
jgi:cytoskeletal protein RodZ